MDGVVPADIVGMQVTEHGPRTRIVTVTGELDALTAPAVSAVLTETLVVAQVVRRLHLGRGIGDADVVLPGRAAKPRHLGGVEARARRSAQRAESSIPRDAALKIGDLPGVKHGADGKPVMTAEMYGSIPVVVR